MKIFYRRPLSLILCIMLGGFSLYAFLGSENILAFIILPIVLFFASFFGKLRFHKLFRVSVICLIIACLLSHCYFNIWYKAYKRFDVPVEISGKVSQIYEYDYSSLVTVNTDSVNSAPLSRYTLLLEMRRDEIEELNLEENTAVSFSAILTDFSDSVSNFDSNSYYLSKGYSAKADKIQNFTVIGKTEPTLKSRIDEQRNHIVETIIKRTDEKYGGLLVALLLGEKEFLSPMINLDFKRIGISHMLALSGLHLSILVLGFSKILSVIGVRKKTRYLSNIIFTCLYMMITGFPISVVRAGLMMIITSLLFLAASSRDSMTALFISVSVICIVNPYSVFDLSLWLSAFATLGILSLAEMPKKYTQNKSIVKRLYDYIKNSVLVSVFAISGTFAITVFSFDRISLISPISTLLFSVLLEMFLYLGSFTLIFGSLIPFGKLANAVGYAITTLAGKLSNIQFISVSSDFIFLKILSLVFSIYFILFIILDIKSKKLYTSILGIFLCVILTSAGIAGATVKESNKYYYTQVDNSERFLIVGDGEANLIEQANYSSYSAYESINILKNEKVLELEKYVLTNYNPAMKNSLEKILSTIIINEIYLPTPENEEEYKLFDEILELELVFRTEILLYELGEKVESNIFTFCAPYREEYKSRGATNIFEIEYNGQRYTYLSSGILKDETKNVALPIINKSNVIIFGRHGTSYYNYTFTYEIDNAKEIIFTSKNMYLSEYIKSYYENNGIIIHISPETVDFIR